MSDRCDLTDLLVDQCGCRRHRGGRTPEEEAAAFRAQLLEQPLWVPAPYPGVCVRCGSMFGVGFAIRRDAVGGWHAECCAVRRPARQPPA